MEWLNIRMLYTKVSGLCGAVLLLLAACGTPLVQYYVLNPVPPAKPLHMHAAAVTSVAIRQVEVPRYLDRPRIVSRGDDKQLHIAEYHQWGGRLRENIAGILGDNLTGRLGSVMVSRAPFIGSTDAQVAVLVDVRQFERLSDGYVHLNVHWQLQRSGRGVFSQYTRLQSSQPVNDKDYAAMAAAMSRLLGMLSDRIATAIVALPPAEHP